MDHWISGASATPAARHAARGSDRSLRAFDIAVASTGLLVLGLPLLLARALGRVHGVAMQGRAGRPFVHIVMTVPDTLAGTVLRLLGARAWPSLLNILRGEMAFVGPRVRPLDEVLPAPAAHVRPGLFNPWFIRSRTAVDFGNEDQADAEYLAHRGLGHDAGLMLRGLAVSLLPPPAASVPGRVQVGDVAFHNVGMTEAVGRLRDALDGSRPQQVAFVNPACVNIAAGHRGYRRALARASLVLPDGIGIKIAGGLLGTPLKQNVNGTDLFPRLCEMLQARRSSLFLLGGEAGVAEDVAAEITRHWPQLRVAGLRNGFFGLHEEGAVAAQVAASGAEVLLVARGVPAQDLFIDRHLPLLGVKVAMGVGGLFDFIAGRQPRAPLWMRDTGLEWLYRLLNEPARLWRRYLIGNVTFLARMALQRLGLRRPAADALPAPRVPAASDPGGVRAVVFATARAAADLPVPADFPAALLPLGSQTLIEQVLEHLAHAAVTDAHVVVSDQPETLRARLGDGSRWGLRLHWHLARDAVRPYGLLSSAAIQSAHRVLIGHADVCPGKAAVLRLASTELLAMEADDASGAAWSGWASLSPRQLAGLEADLDRRGLLAALHRAALPVSVQERIGTVSVRSAPQLLAAAFFDDGTGSGPHIPASWIRRPWGAMSPLAHVHPDATLTGPVFVGPGCIVQSGARVGPCTVLSQDVVVSRGTCVEHSVILPHTYIAQDLELLHTVVNGARVRNVRLGVDATAAPQDAVLTSLVPSGIARPSLAGRAAALLTMAALALPLTLRAASLRVSTGVPVRRMRQVVTGRGEPGAELPTTLLRCSPGGGDDGMTQDAWAMLAGLLDVTAGRRSWFGMRPRTRSEWYALRPEWQQILGSARIGLLHMPVSAEDASEDGEARAAADVLGAVLSPTRRAWLTLRALTVRRRPVCRHAVATR